MRIKLKLKHFRMDFTNSLLVEEEWNETEQKNGLVNLPLDTKLKLLMVIDNEEYNVISVTRKICIYIFNVFEISIFFVGVG